MTFRLLAAAAATVLLAACASQPAPLQGAFTDLTPHQAAETDVTGAYVRWGGIVVQVEPQANATCFEMMSTRLNASGRPNWARDDSTGRFIACRAGFYDPAIFERGREVTFTGRIGGYENRRIGEYDYRFPKVDAEVIYLWPKYTVVTAPSPWPWWW